MDSNPTGEIIEGRDVVDWTYVDPRFGFAWQPTDSGKTVIRGSIGRFHAGVVFGAAGTRQPPEAPPLIGYWLNWDGEWEQFWEWTAIPDALLVDGTELGRDLGVHPRVEHQVGATSTIGVHGGLQEDQQSHRLVHPRRRGI